MTMYDQPASNMNRHLHSIKSIIATLWSVLTLVGLSGSSVLADFVIEPEPGGQNTAWFSKTGGWYGHSSATVTVPPATGGSIGSQFASTQSDFTFTLSPTVVSGHTYALYHALPAGATSASATIVLGITATGCTGLPTTTDAWQYHGVPTSQWLNTWRTVGTLTASSANPTITFARSSGTSSRTYAAAFYFVDQACQTPAVGAIDGPLTNGQTVVNVSGCAFNATAVYVYTNNDGTHATCIGTNSAPGGNTTVPVTVYPLVRGTRLQATQKVACERQPSSGSTGPLVGAGTNGPIRLCFDLIQTGTPANFIWLSATGGQTGYENPPIGATEILPSVGWQTLTVVPGTDPAWMWNNTPGVYTLPNSGTVTNISIWFTEADASETGPYTVYLDNLRNGDTLLHGWESDAVGASAFMQAPGYGQGVGTTSLDDAPNQSLCVSSNAAVGANCQRLDWQWANPGPNAVRGMGISPLSIFDLSKPISVDVLVLPAGATKPALQLSQPANKILSNSIPTSVSVTATENSALYGATSVTLAYQWQHNGVNIDAGNAGDRTGYDTATLSFTSPVDADAGTYTCVVTDVVGDGTFPGTYTLKTSLVATSVDPLPVIITQPAAKTIVDVGNTLTLSVTAGIVFTNGVSAGLPLSYQWELDGVAIANATDSAYTKTAAVADAGYYDVIVANSFLTAGVTSIVAVVDVVQPGVVVGTGTGLRGDYYNRTNLTGAVTLSRVDPTVNFSWAAGASPDPSIPSTDFAVRWYGQVRALDTDTYTFYVTSDDGARLWVNGQLLVDSWVLEPPTEHSGTISLTANQQYSIVLEFYQHQGGSAAQLRWSGAGGGVVKEIIPMSQSYPGTSFTEPTVTLTPGSSAVNAPVTLTAAVVTNTAAEISSVEFFTNNVLLASAPTSPPYTYAWTPPATGTYNVFAQVQYDKSTLVYSSTNALIVSLAPPPSPVTISNITATTITYGGGGGAQFVLMTTNALSGNSMPHDGWQRLATNFTTGGSFSITPGTGPAFYYIKSE
jgi:PA14 domain/Bacterial Ig domain